VCPEEVFAMRKLVFISFVIFLAVPGLVTTTYAYENVTPAEAYDMVDSDENAYILDCRTEAEWRYVGYPGENKIGEGASLEGRVVNISSKIWKKKNFIFNPSFIKDVQEIFEDKENVVLITMCRSGKRSVDSAIALEDAGYANVYNMVTGFEGSKDMYGYRTVNGWKVDGLPYTYNGGGYQD
jgi:rhodanese-related sulfurtransferase